MSKIVTHRFASGKTDGADATQVQPSNWNDGHAFLGGNAGDILTRDPTDATYGAKWVPSPGVTSIGYDGTSTPYIVLPVGSGPLVDVAVSVSAKTTIHGITVNADTKIGTRVTVRLQGVNDVLLASQSASAPANGTFLNWFTSGPTPLACGNLLDGSGHGGGTGAGASYVFDGARWRLVAHEQGRPLHVAYVAGNYGGVTIPAANISVHDYYVHGSDAHCRAFLAQANVATPVAAITVGGWPFTFLSGSSVLIPAATSIGGYGPCFARPTADLTGIRLEQTNFTNWPAGAVDVMFDLTVPIR